MDDLSIEKFRHKRPPRMIMRQRNWSTLVRTTLTWKMAAVSAVLNATPISLTGLQLGISAISPLDQDNPDEWRFGPSFTTNKIIFTARAVNLTWIVFLIIREFSPAYIQSHIVYQMFIGLMYPSTSDEFPSSLKLVACDLESLRAAC